MTTLVLLAHADASVRAMYEQACSRAGLGPVVVRPFVSRHPGMSAAYDALSAELRRGGRILPQLLARYAQGVAHDRVVLAWWSGGYALGRAVLASDEDAQAIDAVVALDGMHGPLPGPALDASLEGFARFARRAARGECVMHVGHSDVRTPGYASTTQTATRLVELVGPPRAGWRVDAYDVERSPTAEHVAALRGWGPDYVAAAVAALPQAPAMAPLAAPVGSRRDLALRALQLAQRELAAGVREATGRNDGAQIARYFTGARRRSPVTGEEQATGWAAGWDWCAAAASWCAYESMRDVAPPHGWRIAVHEMVTDSRESGSWRDAASGYVPQVGDLCVLARAGGDPRRGGLGHIGRVELVDGGEVVTVDGNAGVAWGVARRRLGDPSIVGWVSYDDEPTLVDRVGDLVAAAASRARTWAGLGVA